MEEESLKDATPGTLRLMLSTIEWLGASWVLLGAWTLAIAGGYWAEFLHTFAIPVSIVSGVALGALPTLAALVFVFIAAMTLYVLIPSLPLWVTLEGRCLLDGHVPSKGNGRSRNPLTSPDLSRRWAFVHILFAVVLAGLVVVGALAPWANDGRLFGLTLVAAMVASVFAFEPARRRADITGTAVVIFYCLMTVSVWAQSSLFILVLRTVLAFAPDSTWKSVWTGAVSFLWLSCLIPLVQFGFAARIKAGWTGDMLKGAVLVILVLATVPLIAPPVAARVVAVALQQKDTDGKPCVVLVASAKADAKDWTVLSLDPSRPPVQSARLAFASLIDTTYYAKRVIDGPTFSMPKEQVSTVVGCLPPAAPRAQAPVAPAATPQTAPVAKDPQDMSYLGAAALVVSLLSLAFAVRAHNHSHRPLVTARITTHDGGNMALSLDILVENSGNRPAFDVLIRVDDADLRNAMANPDQPLPTDVVRVLSGTVAIPVLTNGRSATNSFGWLGGKAPWKAGSVLPITVSYRGLGGQRYEESMTLLLAGDAGFAQSFWGEPSASKGH